MNERLRPAFFDEIYAAAPDPWKFETSPYEQAKYDATIEALDGRRFANGLEIGCSIGVLTQRLAELTDELLAIDVAAAALDRARGRDLPISICTSRSWRASGSRWRARSRRPARCSSSCRSRSATGSRSPT